jgi:hypothetical protein
MVDCSHPLPAPTRTPRYAAWSAICSAERVVVPSVSSADVRAAVPVWPAGSASPPFLICRITSAIGSSCCSTTTIFRPFGS